MRITELLDRRSIALDRAPKSKQETLDMAIELMCASGKIRDEEGYRKQVYLREEESTTGIGEGIAIPHGKGESVIKPGLAAMAIGDRPALAVGLVGGMMAANGKSGFLFIH